MKTEQTESLHEAMSTQKQIHQKSNWSIQIFIFLVSKPKIILQKQLFLSAHAQITWQLFINIFKSAARATLFWPKLDFFKNVLLLENVCFGGWNYRKKTEHKKIKNWEKLIQFVQLVWISVDMTYNAILRIMFDNQNNNPAETFQNTVT